MGPNIWCVNPTGGAKQVPLSAVEKYKALGWVVIPPEKLDPYGRPKQMYFPQYDKNNPTRERKITPTEQSDPKNVLKVESF